jgi:creatinine amidohydrolase
MSPSLRIEELAWPDVEAHLAAGRRTIVLMTASVEQHGPHLPTITDTAIGYAVGHRLAELLGDALLAPVIRPGCSDHHLAFPGSLSIPRAVFIDTVIACVRSLAPHGFSQFVLGSSHGGNFSALEEAGARLREEFAPRGVRILAFAGAECLHAMMRVQNETAAAYGLPQDVDALHAELTETSVMLARHPGLVHAAPWEVGRMGHVDTEELFARGLRAFSPNGIIGDPRGAHAALGEAVVEAVAGLMAEWVRTQRDS